MNKQSCLRPVAIALGVLALSLGPQSIRAEETLGIEPLVNAQTLMVSRVGLEGFDRQAAADLLARHLPHQDNQPAPWQETLDRLQRDIDELREAGVRQVYVVLAMPHVEQGPVLAVARPESEAGRAAVQAFFEATGIGQVQEIRGFLVVGKAEVVGQLASAQPMARPELAQAWQAVAEADVQVAILLSDDVRRVMRETLVLPDQLGGRGAVPSLASTQWVALGVHLPPIFQSQLVVQTNSPAHAEKLTEVARQGLQWASDQQREPWNSLARLGSLLTFDQRAEQFVVALEDKQPRSLGALFAPLRSARENARRTQCQNNLKQIALAFHNFHDAHRRFPARANFDAAGKPLLSWRVHLLPFLDQYPLYKQFRLDEPWDSQHNRKLIEKIPVAYQCPSASLKPGYTTYLVPSGPQTSFAGNEGIKVTDIRDGTSNTLMVLDASPEKAVIWTQPADFEVDRDHPLAGLVEQHEKAFVAARFDGSVSTFAASLDPKILLLLIDPNDGMPIPRDP